jgi:flagellar motility protein MotE (MotC chaperone)
MSSVGEIEEAISRLSKEEFVELERWFDEQRELLWDQEIERDATSGRLAEAYERLKASHAGAKSVPLNDFLDNEKLP